MGESPSARTQRELADLRRSIDRDVDALLGRARADLDPRTLVQRQPVAVFGTLGAAAALLAAKIAQRSRAKRLRRPDHEIERVIERLGGDLGKLKGRARKRLREQIRAEVGESKPKRTASDAAWTVVVTALTAGATELARRLAKRFGDDDRVSPTQREGSPR